MERNIDYPNSGPHPEVDDPAEVLPASEMSKQSMLDLVSMATHGSKVVMEDDHGWKESASTPESRDLLWVTEIIGHETDVGIQQLASIRIQPSQSLDSAESWEIWRDRNAELHFTRQGGSFAARSGDDEMGILDGTQADAQRVLEVLKANTFTPR